MYSEDDILLACEMVGLKSEIVYDLKRALREIKGVDTEEMNLLWIRSFGRNPKIAEVEETQKLIGKFGYDKVLKIYKEATLKGFRNLATLIKALDDNGNIRSREEQIQDKPLKYEELIRLSPDEQRQYKLGEGKLWYRK